LPHAIGLSIFALAHNLIIVDFLTNSQPWSRDDDGTALEKVDVLRELMRSKGLSQKPCDKIAGIPLGAKLLGERVMAYWDYHRTVIGYHGTSARIADALVDGEPFKESTGISEWLGSGAYFWEYAPKQAWWWAKKRRLVEPSVVGAMIRLGNCLDMLDAKNAEVLQKAKAKMVQSLKQEGIEIPKSERIYKNLDCAVFNFFCEQTEDEGELKIDSARGAYVPPQSTKRIWPTSWIYKDTHIQICVRNQSNIIAVWHAHPDGRYGKAKSAP
jgi:hypothetical protein